MAVEPIAGEGDEQVPRAHGATIGRDAADGGPPTHIADTDEAQPAPRGRARAVRARGAAGERARDPIEGPEPGAARRAKQLVGHRLASARSTISRSSNGWFVVPRTWYVS